jgi:hypothetical protein
VRKLLLPLFSLIALLSTCPHVAWGWGPDGHKIVAKIAYQRLSVNAKREVRKLLGSKHMSDVANWADAIRESKSETGPWHFVDIKVEGDGSADALDPHRDCDDGNCVVDKITDFEQVVGDKSASRDERVEALKYLIHFTGDIHQPLHCAERPYRNKDQDQGGNAVHVQYPDGKTLKLHGVWDSTILEEMMKGDEAEEYAQKLTQKLETSQMADAIKEWRKHVDPAEWAMESHKLAVEHAYKGIPVKPPANQDPKLDQQYVDEAKPVIETQLEKAGVRLADILNGLFP